MVCPMSNFVASAASVSSASASFSGDAAFGVPRDRRRGPGAGADAGADAGFGADAGADAGALSAPLGFALTFALAFPLPLPLPFPFLATGSVLAGVAGS